METIFICAIMPVAIVLIVYLSGMYADKKRTQVLIKAIESDTQLDTRGLVEALQKPRKTAAERLSLRLLRGCIFSLIGVALLIVAAVNASHGVSFESDPVTVPMVFGGLTMAVGLSYLIVYFVTRKDIKD
ncbi:MAG: hypothetical protein NC342_03465 [Pseudoflavonifractor sp.]|nr:hypothetical protein [Alloprevotella sp.]MCM1116574.1 hypothetical protein [Pseudoflavonifractor sp.]